MVKFPALLVVGLLALSSMCNAQTAPQHRTPAGRRSAPDTIFFNGTIYTGVGFSDDKPQIVAAMAIRGGKVLAVGTNSEVTRLAGPNSRLHDLSSAGEFIFPGFNDAHTHLGGAGQTKLNLDLVGVKSSTEMLAKVEAFAGKSPQGHWITGGRWDHTLWNQKVLPTRQDLDRVTA
jgi:hypothetical protein